MQPDNPGPDTQPWTWARAGYTVIFWLAMIGLITILAAGQKAGF